MPPAKIISGVERLLRDAHRPRSSQEDRRRLRISQFYRPFPKQQEFHRSPAKYRLFGGAAGPGKSKALLMEAILQAHERAGADTLLLRRTFPELESTLLLYFRRDVPRELYRSYNESKHSVTWWNGSSTRFGYCKNEADVYQYQGSEFLFIGIDELRLFTLKQWQFLTSRNRCPVPGAFPNMAGATNPGNIGHAWVKSLWIDKQPAAGMDAAQEYDPADYAFIAARVWDNPIYATDANYRKTLEALPGHLRRAFLEGDWNVFAGQYFDRFDRARHTDRAENFSFEPWWPRWISMDWGFEHPAVVYWHASVPAAAAPAVFGFSGARPSAVNAAEGGFFSSREGSAFLSGARPSAVTLPRALNRTVTYREHIVRRTAPRELAHQIVALSRDLAGHPERIDAIYLSPDAFAQRTGEASIAEQMGDVLAAAGFPRPIPADNDRVGGWMLMYQMLDSGEWVITDNCHELILTLPALVRDSARVEDVAKMDGDDAADAARYGLKSRVRPGRPPYEQRIAARVTSADPTVRAIQARKAQLDEQRAPILRRGHSRRAAR